MSLKIKFIKETNITKRTIKTYLLETDYDQKEQSNSNTDTCNV